MRQAASSEEVLLEEQSTDLLEGVGWPATWNFEGVGQLVVNVENLRPVVAKMPSMRLLGP